MSDTVTIPKELTERRRVRWLGVLCVVLLTAGCTIGLSVKRPSTDEREAAKRYYRQGLIHQGSRQHDSALESFRRAGELHWSPYIDVRIAEILDAVGRTPMACRLWATLDQTDDLRDLLRKEARGAAETVKTTTGRAQACRAAGWGNPWPVKGANSAPITVFVVGDMLSPSHPKLAVHLDKLLTLHAGKVRLVWLNRPSSYQPKARQFALAAMAAHRQGRFWEVYHRAAQHPPQAAKLNIEAWFQHIAVNRERFQAQRRDPYLEKALNNELALARLLKAAHAPSIFVNGKRLSGALTLKTLTDSVMTAEKDLQAALKSKTDPRGAMRTLIENNNAVYGRYIVDGANLPNANRKPGRKGRWNAWNRNGPVWKVSVSEKDPHWGPADALVTIVEFSDLQCPYCSRSHFVMQQVKEKYGDQVRLVFKHLPLPFHRRAKAAAYASMAAQTQGRFWEMLDVIFTNQRRLTDQDLRSYAEAVGLDMQRFKTDYAAAKTKYGAKLKADMDLSKAVSARGTPNFYINGRQLRGAQPLAAFHEAIDAELAAAKKLLTKGISPKDLYGHIIANGKVYSPFGSPSYKFDLRGRPSIGPANAALTLVKFFDMQCPYCNRIDGTLRQLVKSMKGTLRLVYKNFPLGFHKQARPAARALIAAHRQGRFNEMHALIKRDARKLNDQIYVGYAKTLRLNIRRFKRDMKSPKVDRQIDEDMAEARKSGVRGTPALYVNGRKYQGHMSSAKAIKGNIEKYLLRIKK